MAKVTNLNISGNIGLGAQLFKIASGIGIAYQNDCEFVFPFWEYWSHFKNPFQMFTAIDHREVHNKIEKCQYDNMIFSDAEKNHIYLNLVGNFQSYKYFERYSEKIKYYLTPRETIDYFLRDKYKSFINKNTCCAIHVNIDNAEKDNKKEKLTRPDYYDISIELMRTINRVSNMTFFVFSDNIEKAKIMFGEQDNIHFIHELNPVVDLFLMSMFNNIIISNSPYSWWAAYLNDYKKKKVIAPIKWYNPKYSKMNPRTDLYPNGWRVI